MIVKLIKYTMMATLVLTLVASMPSVHAQKANKSKNTDNEPAIFYPAPPDIPRLQFLTSYSGELTNKEKKSKFRKFIVGEEENKNRMIRTPYGLTIKNGKIFVCDVAKHVVMVLDLKEQRTDYIGVDYPGQLNTPINIAVDDDDVRYVVDRTLKRVMVYNADNSYKTALGDPDTMTPTDVAILGDRLYICDIENHQIVLLDKESGKELQRMGGRGEGEGKLHGPTNLTVDQDGYIYVSDTINGRIVIFDPRGDFYQEIGQLGDTPGSFARPKGLAVDREKRLYVADAAFENIQIFNAEAQILLHFPDTETLSGLLTLPAGMVIDYENTDLFADFVAKGHEIEYLILVANQFGGAKVNVYAFLKADNQ